MSAKPFKFADLKANPKNPRTISDAARGRLAKALAEFGDLGGIILNRKTGLLVGGHQRIEAFRADAASKVEITETLEKPDACGTVARGYVETGGTRHSYREVAWNKRKETAALIAANQHGGEFDNEALSELLAGLGKSFDYDLTGFDADALMSMGIGAPDAVTDAEADAAGAAAIEKAAALAKTWNTAKGQLWRIGEHRLLCGDAESADDVAKLLGKEKPNLMVTDPPYGVEYDADWRNVRARNSNGMGNRIGAGAIGKVTNDDNADWVKAWNLFPGNVMYVWCASLHVATVATSIQSAGFVLRSNCIWAKNHLVIGRGDYHWQHEPCWYAVRKGCTGHWSGDRKQTTLWAIDKPQASETGHSTQKPLECMARPIRNNSKAGDLVYDPFVGSGTTLCACEQLKRKGRAIEIDPGYVAVTLERLSEIGLKPKLV